MVVVVLLIAVSGIPALTTTDNTHSTTHHLSTIILYFAHIPKYAAILVIIANKIVKNILG